MRRLLVLRPEPGASKTVARANALGLDALAVPLFEIEPIAWVMPDVRGFDGLLLTSANAARRVTPKLGHLPVYAVGDATAEAAREAGLEVAATGEVGVDGLLASVDANLRLLHLCGEDRRDPVDARQTIVSIPVYRAKPIDRPELAQADQAVMLVHSPRAGRRLGELVHDRGSIAIAAISRAAADAVGSGWQCVEAASRPSDDALLALAARLCNKPAPK
jgi:uroporphyrinogen-III synthase